MGKNSLCLKGEVVIETGDGEQIARLVLDETAEEFFDPMDTDSNVWAERFIDAKLVGVIRAMVRAHIERVRDTATRGRMDRPYTDWNPPEPFVWEYCKQLEARFHDALLEPW